MNYFLSAVILCSVPGRGVDFPPPAPGAYTQILIPIPPSTSGRPGANGANWTTRIVITNANENPVGAFFSHRYPFSLEPRKAKVWGEFLFLFWIPAPFFLYVKSEFSDQVHFHLRTADTSRDAFFYGTEIPVIRENQARTGKIELMDVPVDAQFRRTLRIYGGFGHEAKGTSMIVRVFALESDELLSAAVIPHFDGTGDRPYPQFPRYAEFDPLEGRDKNPHERFRIELEPSTPGYRYWAFLTVTNNETNQITTIVPN